MCSPPQQSESTVPGADESLPKTPEEDERMMRKAKMAYDKEMTSTECDFVTNLSIILPQVDSFGRALQSLWEFAFVESIENRKLIVRQQVS